MTATAASELVPSVPLRVVPCGHGADLEAAQAAAADFLSALGVPLDGESTRDTPRRMTSADVSSSRSGCGPVASSPA